MKGFVYFFIVFVLLAAHQAHARVTDNEENARRPCESEIAFVSGSIFVSSCKADSISHLTVAMHYDDRQISACTTDDGCEILQSGGPADTDAIVKDFAVYKMDKAAFKKMFLERNKLTPYFE